VATIEIKALGTIRRVIRQFINAEGRLPSIEDLSDLIYDAIYDNSYIRTEAAAERAEDIMRKYANIVDAFVCSSSNEELYNFLITDIRLSKKWATELIENR
jgi:hypothetical protein